MAKRRITAKDVATQAGVSRTTVSYVLNNVTAANISAETRQRVLAAADELGYVPNAAAQALASGRTQTIGLLLPRSQPFPQASSTHYRIIEGLLEIAQQFGVRVLVDSVRETEETNTYLELARNKRIDGLIVSDVRVDDQALYKLVQDPFPIVLLGRLPGVNVSSVEFDNRGGARMAVDHLVAQGHTQIGVIGYAPITFTGVAERLSGYRDSLAAHGIAFDEALIHMGAYSAESGYAATLNFLDSDTTPTALFVTSDEVALGVLAALHEQGVSVPDEMAVVGFDDHPISRFTIPALTTVRLPFEEMGRQAGQMLLDLIGQDVERGTELLLETELIVRNSSGRHKRPSLMQP